MVVDIESHQMMAAAAAAVANGGSAVELIKAGQRVGILPHPLPSHSRLQPTTMPRPQGVHVFST